jgi:hypothetical protein
VRWVILALDYPILSLFLFLFLLSECLLMLSRTDIARQILGGEYHPVETFVASAPINIALCKRLKMG